jgi:hypothetical protein
MSIAKRINGAVSDMTTLGRDAMGTAESRAGDFATGLRPKRHAICFSLQRGRSRRDDGFAS